MNNLPNIINLEANYPDPMKKTIIIAITLIILLVAGFYFLLYPKLAIVTGYNAKILCSCQFVTGIPQDRAEREDLGFSLLWLASNTVDTLNKTVHSSVLGLQSKTAVYRQGRGCTLLPTKNTVLSATTISQADVKFAPEIFPESIVAGSSGMQDALAAAFDRDPAQPLWRTRAVVVLKDGELIGEKYAEGIDQNTPLLGWSMTKSITAALTGILVKRGFWDPETPMPVDQWANDERRNITLKNCLQQTIGLEWEEVYSTVSSATIMLYEKKDMGRYAASFPAVFPPGERWKYSSGTTNIIANTMEKAFENQDAYLNFPQEALFGPIGAKNFIIETDASGHFVGSSYGYAPARSWAKVGLLYLNHGNWNGNQILDSNWVAASVEPAPNSEGGYGYQFWLNRGGIFENYAPDAYWMNGYQGQQVAIHPEENMVIVRLGVTYDQKDFDFDGWTKKVIEAAKKTTELQKN